MTDEQLPWPWPHDTALARARRIAQSYRAVLEDVAPEACHELDEQMYRYRVRWLAPSISIYDDDDWLSAEQVADYAGVSLKCAYEWGKRGLASMRTNEGLRFRFADVRDWVSGRRRGAGESHGDSVLGD